MQPIIIADASCLILLEKIHEFFILQKVFSKITVTQIVADECRVSLPEWVIIENPSGHERMVTLQILLDKG